MRECVQEDVLQAYFDGELSPQSMERVATHLAACAQCAASAREIESESLMIAEAFAPELNMSVPTGRLRLRLDAAIAGMETEQRRSARAARSSLLRSWLGALTNLFSFVPQHAVGFASLVAVVAFGALFAFIALRPQPSSLNVARGASVPVLAGVDLAQPKPTGSVPVESVAKAYHIAAPVKRVERQEPAPGLAVNRTKTFTPEQITVNRSEEVAAVRLLPGEKNYLKVIASLDTAIKAGGDNALRPTLRAEYERNLQVVDEAIAQTRVVAQRNPNDKDAAEFLLSAYQSKVDLMNTMAEQAQLSAMYR